jgi:hypothetical protein
VLNAARRTLTIHEFVNAGLLSLTAQYSAGPRSAAQQRLGLRHILPLFGNGSVRAQPLSQNDSRIFSSFHSQTVQRRLIIRTVADTASPKLIAKTRLRLVTPTTINRTVAPKRPPNKDLRTREHLTEAEVERL